MNKSIITRLAKPEHHGDWHDKPLKWQVQTGAEVQKFSIRKEAELYAKCRQMAGTEVGGIRLFLETP